MVNVCLTHPKEMHLSGRMKEGRKKKSAPQIKTSSYVTALDNEYWTLHPVKGSSCSTENCISQELKNPRIKSSLNTVTVLTVLSSICLGLLISELQISPKEKHCGHQIIQILITKRE